MSGFKTDLVALKYILFIAHCVLHLVSDYILSLDLSHPEFRVDEFFAERSEKEQQVSMVRERGNNNMKTEKVKAAIADYTRAIRVW